MTAKPKRKAGPKDSKTQKPNANGKAYCTKGTVSYEERLNKVAFKPYDVKWEDVAKELGCALNHLCDWRKDHAKEIRELQQERFKDALPDVERALVKSCTGFTAQEQGVGGGYTKTFPPNPKGIELFIGRWREISPEAVERRLNFFADFYPQAKQAGPLLHWDRKWGTLGQDQIIGLMAGRGFGKSLLIVKRAQLLAHMNRGVQGMILAPTYKMLANPIQEYWERSLTAAGIPWEPHRKDSFYRLWGDTDVLFRSYDNVDTSGRGPNLGWALLDEFREGSRYVFETVLGSVRDERAQLRQIGIFSTPNGYDHMWDIFGDPESKMAKSGRAVLYVGTAHDNAFLPESFIDALLEAYDEKVVKQEVYGEFINVEQSRIYYNFDRAKHVGDYPIDDRLPLWIGQDFNYNPMCAVIMQPHKTNGSTEVWVVDEVRMDTSNVDDLCAELKSRGYHPEHWGDRLTVFPDATGVSKSAAAGAKSCIATMEAHGYTNIKHPRVNPLIRDRYASVNGLLRNAKQQLRLFVDKRCRYLVADFERESYKAGTAVRDDTTDDAKKRGHLSDGLGYAIHWNFRIESGWTPMRSM